MNVIDTLLALEKYFFSIHNSIVKNKPKETNFSRFGSQPVKIEIYGDGKPTLVHIDRILPAVWVHLHDFSQTEKRVYYFVSGFTSKVAGTEIGVTEPVPTFSTCFGEPFLPLDPSVYAAMLADKVEKSGAKVYLVNTGWNGTGKRMKLRYTRAMVTAALTGEIEKAEFVTDPTFGVQVPTSIEGVPSELLIPANTWEDQAAYEASCRKLAASFVENFKKYTRMSAEVVAAGPKA